MNMKEPGNRVLARLAAVALVLALTAGCVPVSRPNNRELPGGTPAAADSATPSTGTSAPAESATPAVPAAAGAPAGDVTPAAVTVAPGASATPAVLPLAGAATPLMADALLSGLPSPAVTAGATGTAAGAAAAVAAQYVSPKPGSTYNPITGTIALRYGALLDPKTIAAQFKVAGSASGAHSGKMVLSDDQKTVIFKPDQPFATGETVKVDVPAWSEPAATMGHPGISFSFTTMPGSPVQPMSTAGQLVPPDSAPAQAADPPPRYVTAPADLPPITTTVTANGTAPGYIFAANFQIQKGPSGYYLLIIDDRGEPVYYQKLAPNSEAIDFKVLPDGTLSYADRARNAFVIMDNTYREVKTLQPGGGYTALDFHELLLLPDGHFILMANEARVLDLSKVVAGGDSHASVTAQVIQELDKNLNVVFQWRVLDYFPISDTDQPLNKLPVDYSHINALALDTDGNLLVSIRHLDQVVKIDRSSGAVLWRLGGKGNQFTFTAAPGVSGPVAFYHQHDIRSLADGHLTMFDNHNDNQPQVSRGLEYAIDEKAKTATLVWSWQTNPAPYAEAMGNVQRMANGNSVIGWGTNQLPNISEVKPDGTPALELDFGGSNVTYRAFRFPWHGYPTWPPALAVEANGDGLILSFSWNGATDVTSYVVYGGNARPGGGAALLPNRVAEQPKGGFETQWAVPGASQAYCYYQVVAEDGQGSKAGQPSAIVANPARVKDPACTS